jgi:GNAT superfamily N-acetyltransferase
MGYIIRKFKDSDAKELSNLLFNSFLKINRQDYSDDVIKTLCSKNTSDDLINNSKKRVILVALDDAENKIVGTGSIENDYIIGISTHHEYQKKGIGKKILIELEKIAKKNSINILKLHSSPSAYGFYKKQGFDEVKKVYSKKYGYNIFMIKRLKS